MSVRSDIAERARVEAAAVEVGMALARSRSATIGILIHTLDSLFNFVQILVNI